MIEEELVSVLYHLCRARCGSMAFLTSCFLVRSSKKLPGYEDPSVLANITVWSVKDVEALYELFMRISNSVVHDGLIHKVFYVFNRKQNGVNEFGEFVRSLSVFHPKARAEDKIQFRAVAFKLHDLRQTGFVEREGVKEMLNALLCESSSTMALADDGIERTFAEAETKIEGRIHQEEWQRLVMRHPTLILNISLPHLKDSITCFPSFLLMSDAGLT